MRQEIHRVRTRNHDFAHVALLGKASPLTDRMMLRADPSKLKVHPPAGKLEEGGSGGFLEPVKGGAQGHDRVEWKNSVKVFAWLTRGTFLCDTHMVVAPCESSGNFGWNSPPWWSSGASSSRCSRSIDTPWAERAGPSCPAS